MTWIADTKKPSGMGVLTIRHMEGGKPSINSTILICLTALF